MDVFPEDVFAFGVDARQAGELGFWNRAFTRRADDPKRGLQGDQRWGRIRWIDDEARPAAKNGVKLIFATHAETSIAAVLKAGKPLR